MDARILEIVFCLMDYVHDGDDQMGALSEYSNSLKGLGYTEQEISSAYNWILDNLSSRSEKLYSSFPERTGTWRVLTDIERARLTPAAYGFLLKLSNMGLLDPEQMEVVLDRLALSGQRLVTPEQVKLMVSAVMFTEYGDGDRSLFGGLGGERSTRVN